MESVQVVKKRKVSITCLPETKWKEDKVKELTNGYKFFYARNKNMRIGVDIVVDKDLNERVLGVKMLGYRII